MKNTLLAFLLLSGCISAPYYQRVNANGIHRVGYSDTKLSDTMYRVKYLDEKDAYNKFLIRASEISKESGYRYFTIKDVGAIKENTMMVNAGAGVVTDLALSQYEATITLQKDKIPECFEAEEILKNNLTKEKK